MAKSPPNSKPNNPPCILHKWVTNPAYIGKVCRNCDAQRYYDKDRKEYIVVEPE